MGQTSTTSKLIVFSGLPGTGKSTLAEALGRRLGYPVFAFDQLVGALTPLGVPRNGIGGEIGYALLTTLGQRQLLLGQSAILDCVASRQETRLAWQRMASEMGALFLPILTICSDELLHRSRMVGRERGIPGWYELTWDDVQEVQRGYQDWTGSNLTLDARDSFDSNFQEALAYVIEAGKL